MIGRGSWGNMLVLPSLWVIGFFLIVMMNEFVKALYNMPPTPKKEHEELGKLLVHGTVIFLAYGLLLRIL